MAVSTDSRFNHGVQGIPGIGADFDVFETSSTPKFAVGTRFTRSDGAEFVYSHFGAALSSGGLLVSTDVSESYLSMMGSSIYASGSVTAIAGEIIKPGTIGSHYVEIILPAVTADKFAGGYFQTVDGDGFGYTYRIRGNTAGSAKTSGAKATFYLELYEPLQQTLSTIQTSSFRIVGSPYANLESATAATDMIVSGVTTCSHAASTYGWVQTSGVAGIRSDGSTIALGSMCALSDALSGCISYRLAPASIGSGQVVFKRPPIGICIGSAIAAVKNQLIAVRLFRI